jgi:hypothetical protein
MALSTIFKRINVSLQEVLFLRICNVIKVSCIVGTQGTAVLTNRMTGVTDKALKSKDPKTQPCGAPEFVLHEWEVDSQNSN